MKNKFAVCLIPLALSLFGCATPVPVAQNFPMSDQLVANTVHHWDVVAADVVNTTLNAISANAVLQNRPIYVPRFADASSFESVFSDFLINHMVSKNMPVNVCSTAEGSKAQPGFLMDGPEVQINYEARIIRHRFNMPNPHPGEITILSAGVAVLRGIFESGNFSRDFKIASSIAGIGALEWWANYRGKTTRTELLITTTITENNRFIMRRGDIYYVPDEDARLFLETAAAPRFGCAGEGQKTASAKTRSEALNSVARTEMVEKAMYRINPHWTWSAEAMMLMP